MKFLIRKKDGFTLVEMLIALVLMGIISVGMLSFINYMYGSYKRSETLWIEEQAVHKVAKAIYDLSGLAFQAEILNNMPTTPRSNTFYIFGDSSVTSSPRLTAKDAFGDYLEVNSIRLNGAYFEPEEHYPMDLIFKPAVTAGGDTLQQAVTFTLTGRKANFSLDTTVYFPNMDDKEQLVNTAGASGGRALAFQTWGDKITSNLKSIIIEMSTIACCRARG
jgi:prepilin-type N-terminal cleavage/methylation domain-containing protein